MVMPQKAPRPSLRSDATYVLVGGLGGIGRAFASVMVQHLGARHLVFISRSGASTPSAQDTIKALERHGATITVLACDAADKTALQAALNSKPLPPIKGVIQLGLVIKNALFRNMDISTWVDSLRPKVEATWNLHELLPVDMDFFVLLSSMSGIWGVTSQAAYNAAGTFQDAFASYRNNKLGWAATTTIDLGMITGVGYVANHASTQNQLLAQGFEPIPEAECMALIEACLPIHDQAPGEAVEVDPGNIMTGIWPGRVLQNKGIARILYSSPQFAHVRQMGALEAAADTGSAGDGAGTNGTHQQRIRDLLPLAETLAEAESLVLHAVVAKMASLLMISDDEIGVDYSQSMSSYGLDSLVAVVSH
jgi:NADP-dependent 3-hydroxy acid dehydrogenase YdfG